MHLNYAIYINNRTSYSLSGLNFLRGFIKEGVQVRLFPMDQPTPSTGEFGEVSQAYYRNNPPHHFKDAPSLRFAHLFDGFTHVSNPRILYTVFEIDKLSPLEESAVLSNDLVITSNNYHADVLRRYHRRVAVVPLGVDHSIFNPNVAPPLRGQLNIPDDATVFITTGKWERRKLQIQCCNAFNLAFDPGDNVYYVMICDNPFINGKEYEDYIKNSKMGEHFRLLPKVASQRELAALMKNADCMVAPSRAEGFNLPAIESLSCGKHLITTNVTAMADYCSPINSHLIELSSKELAYDPPFFNGSAAWYKWEQKHTKQLADLFSHIHYLKQHNDLKPNWDGVATSASYSWDTVSRQLIEEIFE